MVDVEFLKKLKVLVKVMIKKQKVFLIINIIIIVIFIYHIGSKRNSVISYT